MLRVLLLALFFLPTNVIAQAASGDTQQPISLITDVNGDGTIEILAFGDSLTRGVGDFVEAGEDVQRETLTPPEQEAGYPLRVEGYLRVGVTNAGVPGEDVVTRGAQRFAQLMVNSRPDIVIIGGGANDAIRQKAPGAVYNALQSMVNIAFATGAVPLVINIAPPCCQHAGYANLIREYNYEISRLALINSVGFADIAQAFSNTSNGSAECELLNLPEGLHPNIEGYDVTGELITGRLLGIDLLTVGGAAQFETALNLPAGSVRTVPTPGLPVP